MNLTEENIINFFFQCIKFYTYTVFFMKFSFTCTVVYARIIYMLYIGNEKNNLVILQRFYLKLRFLFSLEIFIYCSVEMKSHIDSYFVVTFSFPQYSSRYYI